MKPSHALWERGFRPFFLGAGLHAALIVPAWTAMWLGAARIPAWLMPSVWHAHEMIFGLAAAAIAGFLLTATPVWTGRAPLVGRGLAALSVLWLAGRLAMLAPGVLGTPALAMIDGAFLPALALVLARTVWRTGQLRNYGVVALVVLLAIGNALIHAEALGLVSGLAPRVLRLGVDVVVTLVVVIGGRITPAFTANALRRAGNTASVRSWPALDRATVAAVLAVVLVDLVAPRSSASGVAAGVAALLVTLRLAGWKTHRILRDPLVLSLHAGTAWVAIGLALVAAGDLGRPALSLSGLHALTAGAMGGMILAVMTRVSLGHTGRPLVLPRAALASYVLVHLGALARVAVPVVSPEGAAMHLASSGVLWGAAFAAFTAAYAPILTRPRIDGKPG